MAPTNFADVLVGYISRIWSVGVGCNLELTMMTSTHLLFWLPRVFARQYSLVNGLREAQVLMKQEKLSNHQSDGMISRWNVISLESNNNMKRFHLNSSETSDGATWKPDLVKVSLSPRSTAAVTSFMPPTETVPDMKTVAAANNISIDCTTSLHTTALIPPWKYLQVSEQQQKPSLCTSTAWKLRLVKMDQRQRPWWIRLYKLLLYTDFLLWLNSSLSFKLLELKHDSAQCMIVLTRCCAGI